MKILCISHTYPPIKGGVEKQNYDLFQSLSKKENVTIIANGKGKIFLPIFLPITFFRAFFSMSKFDVCLLGNGVLAPIGAVLKFFHPRKKFFCIIHGLDITYANREGFLSKIYKVVNIPSLKKMKRLFAVGNATIEEAANIGINKEKCIFIPNGVNEKEFKKNFPRKKLSELFGRNVEDKKVILRVGRFVPHKGTDWFIENIMPKLPQDVVMIATGHRVNASTAGDGDNFLQCERAIIDNHLEERVKLMPSLAQEKLEVLLNTVDLVVSPNVKVPGTMEGFGINVIEAGVCERVVVASNLEGLSDAIKNGENGILVEPENAEGWIRTINKIFENGPEFIKGFGEKIGHYVRNNYNWDKISERYLEEMKK